MEVYMNYKTMKYRLRLLAECFLICLAAGAGTSAIAHGGGGFHGGGFHGGGFHGGGFHGYGWSHGFHSPHVWGGFYIGPEWFWGPTVVIEGAPYYYYSGIYYTLDGDGLVAVTPPPANPAVAPTPSVPSEAATAPANTPPKVESTPAQQSGETVIVNMPNTKGGYTPVKLVKTDKGYLGPQGEFYPDHPTVDELKVLYGR
jgi:hypothetical protein